MELADIKGFIKRYSESYLFLSDIKSLSWMYIFIGLIPLCYGIVTRKFIVMSIVVTMVVFYTVITNILVRKMTSVSYYQRFLLTWQFIIVYIVVFSNATIFISGNCDVG